MPLTRPAARSKPVRRELELHDATSAVIALLDAGLAAVTAEGDPDAVIDVVSGGVIVDVDHGAKYELHTGIQQVTRSLLPIWSSQREVVPAAWTLSAGSLRRLSEPETRRITSWKTRSPDVPTSSPTDGPGTPRRPVPALRAMAKCNRDARSSALRRVGPGSGHR